MSKARMNFRAAAALFAAMLLCVGLTILIDDPAKSVILIMVSAIAAILSVVAFCLGMSHAEEGK